jgi:hypothetical protein
LTAAKLTTNTNRRELRHIDNASRETAPGGRSRENAERVLPQDGTWYKRILKPDPRTGAWTLQAESTHCKEDQRQAAIDYVARRTAELDKSARLGKTVDPGRITLNELFDDLLASVAHEPTRKNYEWVLTSRLRPFFWRDARIRTDRRTLPGFP